MTVALGAVGTCGGIRFAVLSQLRVMPMPWPGRVAVIGEKAPVCVLFEQNGRRWAQSVSGHDMTPAEVAQRYPDAWRRFDTAP